MGDKDGGPAFPYVLNAGSSATRGMTLRDWFAGEALAGMMANPNIMPDGKWRYPRPQKCIEENGL